MNSPARFTLSAALVLAAGTFLLIRQRQILTELRQPAPAASLSVIQLAEKPGASPVPARPWSAPPVARPAPDGRLLDRLGEKLIATFPADKIATMAFSVLDGSELSRIAFAARLTETERAAFAEKISAFRQEKGKTITLTTLSAEERQVALADIDTRRTAWIAAQLGPERQALVDAAAATAGRASAERTASRAVNRISRAVDLTPAQKDALYTGFLDAGPPPAPAAAGEPLAFRVKGTMTEEPPPPDISEAAEEILTPEQIAAWKDQRSAAADGQNGLVSAMQSLAPAAISALQELLEEDPGDPVPGK